MHQVAFDCGNSATYARIIGRQKANQCHHQQAGVEFVGVVRLGKGADFLVEGPLADFGMNLVTVLPPAVDGAL